MNEYQAAAEHQVTIMLKALLVLIWIIVGIWWFHFLKIHDRDDDEFTDDQMGL